MRQYLPIPPYLCSLQYPETFTAKIKEFFCFLFSLLNTSGGSAELFVAVLHKRLGSGLRPVGLSQH